jgi:hypothetical protein
MATAPVVEESLERMVEAQEVRQALEERDDDAEVALEELIGSLADIRVRPFEDGTTVRSDEFVCRSCNMAMHRSLLADPDAPLCLDCFVPGAFGF